MKKLIFSGIFCCLFLFGYSQSTSPILWLKSDSVDISNKTWPDQSSSAHHAPFSSDTLRIEQGIFNFNPAIRINGNGEHFRIPYNGLNTSPSYTILTVFYTKDTTECGLWGTDSLCSRRAGQTTRNILGPDSLFQPYLKSEGRAVLNRVVQQWPSGNTATPDSNSTMILGSFCLKQDSINDFKGHLAEYMIFDDLLTGVEQAQVETYLAIKYGISLEQGNYVSSDKVVLWNRKNDSLYSNHITGIGKDSYWKLDQKQSSATSEKGFLTVGAEKVEKDNQTNGYQLNDKDFIIWGDNNGSLSGGDSSGAVMPLLQRRWKMNVSGSTAKQIKTQIIINKNNLSHQDSVYFLVIARSTDNDFSGAEYIQNDTIMDDSLVVFNEVFWDTDGSGSDLFSFGTSQKLILTDSILRHPKCAYSDEGEVLFETREGHTPYKYAAKLPGSDSIVYQWTSSMDSLVQDGFKGGLYQVTVTDAAGLTAEATVEIIAPDSLHINLGEDRVLRRKDIYQFDASTQVPDSIHVSYQWKGDKGFSSTLSSVKLNEPDVYTLSVINDSGCVYTDQILLSDDPLKRFDVTPSLVSSGGSATVHVQFVETTDMQLSLVGPDGKEYWLKREEGKKSYNFNETFQEAGVYYLILKTSSSFETRKILVVK